MNEHYRIYCDLDGVIADFDSKVSEINEGVASKDLGSSKLWASVSNYNSKVEPFFESLAKIPDADDLWKFLITNFENVAILSACGYTPRDGADQKRRWVKKHLGESVVSHIVTKSPDKATFASPNSILIDDRMKSITPWVDAGGIGILHTSAADTISQLKELLTK